MVRPSQTKTSNQFPENVPKRLQMNTINETLSLGRLDPIGSPGGRRTVPGDCGTAGLGERSTVSQATRDDYTVSVGTSRHL